jgi:hypothetical protein
MGVAGVPDIIAIVDGRYIGIEVKDAKGRLNENQIAFHRTMYTPPAFSSLPRRMEDVEEGINYLKRAA